MVSTSVKEVVEREPSFQSEGIGNLRITETFWNSHCEESQKGVYMGDRSSFKVHWGFHWSGSCKSAVTCEETFLSLNDRARMKKEFGH